MASSERARFDVLVVGCGAMGSAVSYNLARKGMRVATLERFGVNHQMGSSHGKTRIIRLAYYEDPRYVPLLRRAFDSWRELEGTAGRKLMEITGGLMIGRPEGELVMGVLKTAKEHGIQHRVLSPSEVEGGYEAFRLDEGQVAVHEESAGVLFPERCVEAFVDLAKSAGCEFLFNQRMTSWKSAGEGVEVETEAGRYQAGRVVFCAGAWNKELLPGVLSLEIERQVPFWFSAAGKPGFAVGKMPVFISEEDGGRFFYGIPDVGEGVKVARTHGGELCSPDEVRREVTKEDAEPVMEFIERRLRGHLGPPIASTTCLYSNTPDLNFAIGAHPTDPRATVVSACSGHGFKFASVLGEVVADLVTGERAAYDLSFLSVDRFRGSPVGRQA